MKYVGVIISKCGQGESVTNINQSLLTFSHHPQEINAGTNRSIKHALATCSENNTNMHSFIPNVLSAKSMFNRLVDAIHLDSAKVLDKYFILDSTKRWRHVKLQEKFLGQRFPNCGLGPKSGSQTSV